MREYANTCESSHSFPICDVRLFLKHATYAAIARSHTDVVFGSFICSAFSINYVFWEGENNCQRRRNTLSVILSLPAVQNVSRDRRQQKS